MSEKKFRQLLRYFAIYFSATDVALLTGLRRRAIIQIFLKIRHRIAEECERISPAYQRFCEKQCDLGLLLAQVGRLPRPPAHDKHTSGQDIKNIDTYPD